MEKREQVFVSSTYLDLVEERQAVIQALLMADCFPAGMELFPASNEERWELIKRVVEECDYYVVIVGGRYGSTDSEGMSYTEREFDYADEIGLPILGFLHGEPGEIPAKHTELEPEAQKRLNAFREKVGQRMCRYFTGADDLAGQVALSLMAARKRFPAVGWVRGSEALTQETKDEISMLRERIAELERDLSEAVALPGYDVEGLRQGDDSVVLRFAARVGVDAAAFEWGGDKDAQYVVGVDVELSWNTILREVGPLLMDEDTESAVVGAIQRLSLNTWRSMGDADGNRPRDILDEEGQPLEHVDRFDLTRSSRNEIFVQLRALGVIEKGTKKRSLTDTHKYWRLTSRGEQQVLGLVAQRREPETPTH